MPSAVSCAGGGTGDLVPLSTIFETVIARKFDDVSRQGDRGSKSSRANRRLDRCAVRFIHPQNQSFSENSMKYRLFETAA